jgi:L-ascorbate metabolism protein UlaG (beta-lactamase superfamily)
VPDLAAAIAAARVPEIGVRLWSLGQAGFLLRSAERTVVVDPWLSEWLEREEGDPDLRARPAPLAPHELTGVDLVLITHEHADHLDPGTVPALAEANPAALWVAPAPIVDQLSALGVPDERVSGVLVDQRVEVAGVGVEAVAAAHAFAAEGFGGYSFWTDADGRHRAVGYLVELGGVRVLHAGDTVWWPGYAERLERLAPDLAILPINGRDAAREARGVVGNLEPREAADLAVAARIPLVVPCHWDGVAGNTEDPAVFVSYAVRTYPSLGIRLPAVGEGVHVVGR